MRIIGALALCFGLTGTGLGARLAPGQASGPSGNHEGEAVRLARPALAGDTTYEVYALRYAVLPGFPLRSLVAGVDSEERVDIAMMVWLLRGADGRNVLVDTGFYRDAQRGQWHPRDYVRPDSLVERLGLRPEDISDIVLTHMHWDHAGGLALFPNAHVWVQRAEYEYYIEGDGRTGGGVMPEDRAKLRRLRSEGRLTLVDGDAREILPGITVYTGGRHTYASQYPGVRTPRGTVVVASDDVYLYRNLEQHMAIAQTFDPASNLRAQDRMRRLAASPRLILPGHDPAVFVRFPEPGNGVARIR